MFKILSESGRHSVRWFGRLWGNKFCLRIRNASRNLINIFYNVLKARGSPAVLLRKVCLLCRTFYHMDTT